MTAPRRTGRTRKTRDMLATENAELRAVLEGRAAPSAELGIPMAAGDDLQRFMGELGAGTSRVTLWRTRRDGRPEYVRTFELGEWNLEAVRDEYGGGTYLAKFFDGDDQEQGARTFIIAEPARHIPTADQLDLSKLLPPPNAGPTSSTSDPMAMFVALAQAQSSSMQAMMSVLAPLLVPRQDDTTRLVLLELLKREPAGPDGMLSMFQKFQELMGDRANGDGDGYGDVMRELGRPLARLLESRTNGNGAPAAHVNGNGAPAAAPTLETPSVRVAAETPFLALRPHMGRLFHLARQNANPAIWAAALEVEYEQEVNLLLNIVDRVGQDTALAALVETFPDAEPFRDWFGRLLGALVADGERDQAEPDDAGPDVE